MLLQLTNCKGLSSQFTLKLHYVKVSTVDASINRHSKRRTDLINKKCYNAKSRWDSYVTSSKR